MASFSFCLVVLFMYVAVTSAVFSPSQIDELLFGHNKARQERDLTPLVWDADIAAYAQSYSDQCIMQHNPAASGLYGENIAWGQSTVYQANRGWIDNEYEVKWKCGTPIDRTNYDHITQVLWAATTKVGCGYTECSNAKYYVCNYHTPGNYLGQLPYPANKCKNQKPCTPASTCLKSGGSFNDTACGRIECNVVTTSATASTTTSTATTSKPSTTTATTGTKTTTTTTGTKTTTGSQTTTGSATTSNPTVTPTIAPTVPPHSPVFSNDLQGTWSAAAAHNLSGQVTYQGQKAVTATLSSSSQDKENFLMFYAEGFTKRAYSSLVFSAAVEEGANKKRAVQASDVYFFWNGQRAGLLSLNSTWQSFSVPVASVAADDALPSFVFWNDGATPLNIFLNNIYFSASAPSTTFTASTQFDEVQKSDNFTVISAPPSRSNSGDLDSSSVSLSASLFFVVLSSIVLVW